MNYAAKINIITHFHQQSRDGERRVRAVRKSFVIDTPNRKTAEGICHAINSAHLDDGVVVTQADTGLRVFLEKGSVVLTLEQVEEIYQHWSADR